jgi:hypothetical protein
VTTASGHHPTIPAELLKVPPRKIRLKPHWLKNNFTNIFLFAIFALGSMGLVGFGVGELLFLWAAPVLSGRVVGATATRSTGRHGGVDYKYTLGYAYKVGGIVHYNTQDVSRDFFEAHGRGSFVPISALDFAGHFIDEIHMPAAEYRQERMVIWAIAAIPVTMVALAYSYSWLRPRYMVRHGQPVMGVITRKKVRAGGRNGISYYIFYDYTDPQNCRWVGQKRVVNRAGYNAVHQGQHVVVLCDPWDSGRSLVYKCGQFEAV